MKPDSSIAVMIGRGLTSDLAQRIVAQFSNWESFCAVDAGLLAEHFLPEELDAIRYAKERREISRETVSRLINECGFRCCLCWNIDNDSGVVIHHIRAHATAPDDRYENLIILCPDHHSKIHTKWELARHPFPPELLIRRKEEFIAAIAAFKAGKRVAPGREKTEASVQASPPLPPVHFIGRDIQAREIGAALVLHNRRVAIVGMGGIGKTALVLKVVDLCRQDFPGGVFWIEAATDFGALPEMLRTWIRSLGSDTTGLEIDEQLALFSALLTKRVAIQGRLLLLIDDVRESAINDLVRLSSRVPPNVSILITTRETTVAAAVDSTLFRLAPLEREYSRQLLQTISGSSLIKKEEGSVDTLLSLLGDLPLAVELVARQIAVRDCKPGFSIAKLCQRLEEFDPQLLSFPGHRGIVISFALSYEHLDENEQRLFRALGVFASGALYTASVAIVCEGTKQEVETTLDRLVLVSVLSWGTGASDYLIHPLLHKYSEFLFNCSITTEQSSTRGRFYEHYTAAAITTAKTFPTNLKAIDQILPNLIRAIEYASANSDHQAVLETVLSLSAGMCFFTSRNLECESIKLFKMAITTAKHLADRDGESAALGHLGTAYYRLGMIKDAVAHFEHAITLSRATGNDYDLASHLQNLGNTLLSEARDLPRVEILLREAFEAANRSHNVDAVIGCLSTLASLHRGAGSLQEAARLYTGALKVSRLAGNRLCEGNNQSNLGLVIKDLGDVAQGEKMIREALAIAIEIQDRRGEGNRTGHLGGILFAKANQMPPGSERSSTLESAREYTLAALSIANETGDMEKATCWLMNLGNIIIWQGNEAEGIKHYQQALGVAQTAGFAMLEAQVHLNLGAALVYQGQLQTARDHFYTSRALLEKTGSPLISKVEESINHLNRMIRT